MVNDQPLRDEVNSYFAEIYCVLASILHRDHARVMMMPTRQHRVDHLKGLIDLFSDLGTGQDNLAAYEDEEHNFGLDHTIDETGEQLGLVGAEVVMAACQTLQTDGKLDVARADDVLDLKIRKLGIEPQLLDDSRVFA